VRLARGELCRQNDWLMADGVVDVLRTEPLS
jgi:hypothetical protein